MSTFTKLLFLTLTLLGGTDTWSAEGRRTDILFLGDNGHHKPQERFPQLQQALGGRGINLTYSDRMTDLNPVTLAAYDGLMIYANTTKISPDQEKAMLDFVADGKGLLPIHCASYCFLNSDAYVALVGAQFKSHQTGTFTVPVTDAGHPVTNGFAPFETWDETYVHHRHNQDRTVLQVRDENGTPEPWTWVRNHGKGRVFYTAYGHDERTWGNPGFQDLVFRGIHWAIGDSAARELDALNLPPFVYTPEPTVQNYEKRNPYPQFQHGLSPADSRKYTQWPAGYRYELFASDPDIVNPIYMAFDARGRCWISETVDYPNTVNDDRTGNDRIRILEDTDGDGKADKFTVFADHLNIPTSFAFHEDGIIVAAAPNFYFMRDTNGDDRCDETKTISTGWGVRDTHAGPSNLQYGFDNYFYGAVGYSGYNEKIGGKDVAFNSGIYRFKPDFSEVEFLSQFSNNTWGLGFTESFDLFGSTANNTHSVYIGIPNRYYAGITGLKAQRGLKIDGHYAAYPITGKIRQVDVMGGFTAAAGHNFYTARSFPKEYWNRTAFVAEPTMHLLANCIIEPDGAGYKEVNGWNLTASADEWYAPVHAQVGPDGAVWLLDWYNFIIQHNPTPSVERGGFAGTNGKGGAHENPLRDRQHGRIWRVVYPNAPASPNYKLAKSEPAGLIRAVLSDNLMWRLTAQRLIVERGNKDIVPQLVNIVRTAPTDEIGICGGAVHALYALQGLNALEGDALAATRDALKHNSPAVRKAAAAVLPRDAGNAEVVAASGILTDANLNVRKDALLACSEFAPNVLLGTALLKVLAQPEVASDPWLQDAALIAAAKQGYGLLLAYAAADVKFEKGAAATDRPNLFQNGTFENVAGTTPRDWRVRTYGGKAVHFAAKEGRNGSGCAKITSESGSDTSLYQDVDVVKGHTYEISGWIRTDKVEGAGTHPGFGAMFNAHMVDQAKSAAVKGTSDWKKISMTFTAPENRASINLLFGGWGWSKGTAWYDDVALVDLSDNAGSLLEKAVMLAVDNVGKAEVTKLAANQPAGAQAKLIALISGTASVAAPKELTGKELLAAGKKVFQEICFSCHGPNGEGTVGPNLTDLYFLHGPTRAEMETVIRKGVIEKGMLPWEQTLDAAQLKAVSEYAWSLRGTNVANGKPPEGLPAPGTVVALTLPKGAAPAASRPLRVLYVGQPNSDVAAARVQCANIMEDLGRDAVFLDFLDGTRGNQFTDNDAARYDLIIDSAKAPDAKALMTAVNSDVNPAMLAAWRQFQTAREPEKREPHPQVANYEKRQQTITFQHAYTPGGSMQRTQVPADMKLELFAAEPDIVNPIAFAWDERGRLWVSEARDYPHGHTDTGMGNDDIKICEDTDGDGKADKFTIFADHLNIPTSLTFVNGGIIVSQPPNFLFLKSSKGDDHADIRQEILPGWGIGDTHGQAGNLHYGYDNWLYGSVGYDGFNGEVAGKPVKFTMGTYRFKADGSALEFLHQFTNNTWAHSANQYGDQFGGTANGAPIFFGGIPASVVPDGLRIMTAKRINVIEAVHAITPNYRQVDVFGNYPDGRHWGGYTAAAGSNFIYSKNLPPRLQGLAMVCEPTMKVIALMDVKADGAGYKANDAMNILASSDEWHSPVYAEVGPDGAIWYADWENFIIQHNPTPSVERGGFKGETGPGGAHKNDLRDHERGRIYRIVWDKATPPAIRSLAGADDVQLVTALSSDSQFWRLKAQQLLVEGKRTSAVDSLKKLVTANDGNIAAVHALWTLHGLGRLDDNTHKAALLAADAGLRRNAIRALGTDAAAQSLFFGSGCIADRDLNTRLAAFVKLAEFPTTPQIQTMVKQLSVDAITKSDEWLREAARLLTKVHKAAPFKEGPNLLANGDLEKLGADGFPEGWKRRDYNGNPGTKGAEWKVVSGPNESHSGNAIRCITRDNADTSFYQEVPIKPNTDYKLSGWVRGHGLRWGKISFNDHIGRAETELVTRDTKGEWRQVETTFNSGKNTVSSVNILHVAKGDGYFDDVKLAELLPDADAAEQVTAGDATRGEAIFWKHPTAACMTCHMLGGKGSTVGPPLDGIASRQDEAYITESLVNPNAKLTQGFEAMKISPMPPMGLILKPQELADIKAFILTLKK